MTYGVTCCRAWAADERPAVTFTASSMREARATARGMYHLARRIWVWKVKGGAEGASEAIVNHEQERRL